VQKWVQIAADESSVFQRELWKKKTIESLNEARADGVTIYEVDQSLFAEKVKPMYDAIKNEDITNLVTRIREIK
jgi:TRAP-type C4-dicarboxylate transport system substrate-binding protein